MKLVRVFVLLNVLILTSCASLKKQNKTSTTAYNFIIKIEKQSNEVILECDQGCSWKQLSFIKNNYQPQLINEIGMTDIKSDKAEGHDSNLADFLISVIKTNEGFELEGIKGTSWEKLSFTLRDNQRQVIDQNGMK